jgi:hypothetical protein
MLLHMDGNLGFDPINQRLKWAVRRAEEHVRADEHTQASTCLRQVASKMVKESKVEVNTGLSQMNKMSRITLDLFTPKANELTSGLGPAFLSLFEYAIANVAPTRVQVGEDQQNGIIVLVFDRLECPDLNMRDLTGKPKRAHVRIPAIDLAGHGRVATGANLQVRHAAWALAEVGLFDFNPHADEILANASSQIFRSSGWSKPSTDFETRIGDGTKVRIIFRRLPTEAFVRRIHVPEWVSTLFTDLGSHAVPEVVDVDSMHPGEEAVFQFGGGIENYGPRSQYVMYAGKSTSIPQTAQQPVTNFIFHPALGKGGEEFTIPETKLRLRLRMNRDVRRLIPRPVGVEPTDKEQTSAEPEESLQREPVTDESADVATATAGTKAAAKSDSLCSDLNLKQGYKFKVADEDRVLHDVGVDGSVLGPDDPSYLGLLATLNDVKLDGAEITLRYHLTVQQDDMLHTNTGELVKAHRVAEPNMSACKLARFEFVGKPIHGGPRDVRDYKINLMAGRELSVIVTYKIDVEAMADSEED